MLRVGLMRSTRAARVSAGLPARMAPSVTPAFASGQFFVRFNSSSGPQATEISDKLTSFADATEKATTTLTSDQLGYLDSIGMGQGYGPTALIEKLLEVSHVYTGLPWWGTIIFTTVAVRLAMFPLYYKASVNSAKMSKVKPQLDEALNALKEAENPQEQVQAAQRRKLIMKENDIHLSHSIFPMFQLPIAYGFFQALRKMAIHPVEGFSTQGYAWFEDLSQVDPYLGLQAIAAVVVITMVRLGGETGAQVINPMVKKVMTYVPILSIFITKEFSAAVVLYFAANATFSFLQTMTLRNSLFRRITKMPPIVAATPIPGAKAPPATVREWWKEFTDNMSNSTKKSMKETNNKVGAIQKRKDKVNSSFIKRH